MFDCENSLCYCGGTKSVLSKGSLVTLLGDFRNRCRLARLAPQVPPGRVLIGARVIVHNQIRELKAAKAR